MGTAKINSKYLCNCQRWQGEGYLPFFFIIIIQQIVVLWSKREEVEAEYF